MKIKVLLPSVILCFSLLSFNVLASVPGDGVNEDFTSLTDEQLTEVDAKAELADTYVSEKRQESEASPQSISASAAGGSKVNYVGTFRQEQSYTCGPAAARNAIHGYTYYNGGAAPSEATLASALGTTTAGTSFSATPWQNTLNTYAPGNNYLLQWGTSSWYTDLANKVIYTIDKVYNYNVVGNIYHDTTSTPINSIYANGAAHYICIYGYNDVSKIYYISDSYSAAPVTYTASYTNTANSTQQRGIIW